jgi:hypothetical protein
MIQNNLRKADAASQPGKIRGKTGFTPFTDFRMAI